MAHGVYTNHLISSIFSRIVHSMQGGSSIEHLMLLIATAKYYCDTCSEIFILSVNTKQIHPADTFLG